MRPLLKVIRQCLNESIQQGLFSANVFILWIQTAYNINLYFISGLTWLFSFQVNVPKPHTQAVNYYSKYKYLWQGIQKIHDESGDFEILSIKRLTLFRFYYYITWHDICAAVNLICKLFSLSLFRFWQFLHIWYHVYI